MTEAGSTLLEQAQANESNLTQRQLLMWVQEQLNPGLASNNMVMTYEIEGDLDLERFRRAFASVVAQFDILRTVFSNDQNGVPQQSVLAAWNGSVESIDFSGEADPRASLESWLYSRCSRPFQLSKSAFDCVLVRLGQSSWLWYFCQNHIITDGTSFSLIYKYVAERYASTEFPFPAASSFSEYAAMEREYRASDRARASASFWSQKLDKPLEPLEPYGLKPGDRIPTMRRITVDLGRRRSVALRRLAASPPNRAVTADLSLSLLFSTLTAAFLHRISGNSRLGIGMPVLNRRVRSVRSSIGPLLEVIAVQVEVDDGDSFSSLLERVRDDLYASMRHAQYGVPAHTRAFDVMLNFHKADFPPFCGMPTRSNSFTGLRYSAGDQPAPARHWRSGEHLSLQIHDFDSSDCFTLNFDFSVAIFPEEVATRAVGHFERLLEAMLTEFETPIHEVELIDADERKQVLQDFNSDSSDPCTGTLVDALEEHFERNSDRTALRFDRRKLNYRQLGQRSAEIAGQLIAAGVSRGDRVAVLLERTEDLPAALLGVMRAGAAYVPLDPEHPVSRNQLILEDAKPHVLLTQSSLSSMLSSAGAMKTLCLDRFAASDPPRRLPKPAPTDLAYLLFTSGSTGRPKGAEITHANLMNLASAVCAKPGMSADEVVVSVATVAFDMAGLDFHATLLAGAQLVIADRGSTLDPGRLQALLERCDATLLHATPATWRMLISGDWAGKSNLRALVGGEPLSRELADELLEHCGEVWNVYGPTETTVVSSVERVGPATGQDREYPIPIGRPIQNVRMYILDGRRRPLPIGVQGDIWVAGAGVGRGYCDRPELTQALFHDDPFVPGERMYRTGDLGRHRADGRIECAGRIDHQVKVRGFRVELGEIERAIDSHASIRECVVMGRPDSLHGNRLSAYLVGQAQNAPDIQSLRAALRDQLPSYMIPVDFIVLGEMPLTPNGKIARNALPEPDASRIELNLDYVAPASPLEHAIAEIWSDLLDLEEVGAQDSFFDLGGTSLAALSLFRQLKQDLGIDLPISTLFDAQTIRRLSAVIEAGGPSEASSAWSTVVGIQPEGRRIPIFCAAGAGGNIHNLERLAKHLGLDQPFYGLQTRGVVGRQIPHEHVEDIASESVADLKHAQPHGPYVLAGYSAGGSVALAMAQHLTAEGEEIAALMLLDSHSPIIPRRSKRERLRLHLSRLSQEGPGYLGRKLVDRIAGDAVRAREAARHLRASIFPERYAHERLLFTRLQTQQRYKPEPYAGSATLFRVQRSIESAHTELAIDEYNGWLPLIEGGLEVIPAPGGHLNLFDEPHVGVLAEQLNRALDRVNGVATRGSQGAETSETATSGAEEEASDASSLDSAPA